MLSNQSNLFCLNRSVGSLSSASLFFYIYIFCAFILCRQGEESIIVIHDYLFLLTNLVADHHFIFIEKYAAFEIVLTFLDINFVN